MYSEVKKAIYGILEASLLFWTKLFKILEEMDYQRNESDWCVMNIIVNGKKFTILWHFDDLKMSHVGSKIVSSFLADIDAEYGKLRE